MRKRLVAISRSTTFIDSARRKALLADLEAQQQAISGPIATADPALAVELQLRLLELSEGVLDRCSDSTGAVIGLFQRGVDALATLAAAAGSDPEALVSDLVDCTARVIATVQAELPSGFPEQLASSILGGLQASAERLQRQFS